MEYQVPRQRDAWFVIRGFVYQVERTIELWLDLAPTDCLELECGEDIDVVADWAAADSSHDRLLEQIKRRDSSLTLNSPEARAALANFVEHRSSNPDLRLRFRFVTNAPAAKERDPAMLKKQVGLDVWANARKGGPNQFRAIASLRHLLRKGSCPTDIPTGTWTKYKDFLSRAKFDEIASLVGDVEWSLTRQDVPELRQVLERRIQVAGLAPDATRAGQVYSHLFVHVFHALSAKGTKRLTAEDRSDVVSAALAAPAETQILKRLEEALGDFKRQLEEANGRLDAHESALSLIDSRVGDLSRSVDATWQAISRSEQRTMAPLESLSDLSPPLRPASCAARTGAVRDILANLEAHNWVAIRGSSGSGKTELARQVLEAIDASSPWVTLRDLDPPSARTRLLSALATIGSVGIEGLASPLLCEAVASELQGKVLVIDDLPIVQHDDDIARLLSRLVASFAARGVRLLTTSAHALPLRLQTGLGELVGSVETPPISSDETLDLFRAFGAREDAELASHANFVAVTTGGHAELVVTALVYLRQRQWRYSEGDVSALLGISDHIRDDVLRRILCTVPDSDARNLLYRVSVAIGTFNDDDVGEIAACAPPISHPRERLAQITGLWVQHQGAHKLSVCPLVKGLDSELEPSVLKCVHAKLGLRIMRQETVGPVDVLSAVGHFLHAGEHDHAGRAYLGALASLPSGELPRYDAGLFSLWTTQSLPAKMTRALRIAIRSLQLGLHTASGKDAAYLAADVLDLAAGVPDEEVSELAPTISRAADLAAHDFERTTSLVVRVARAEVRGELHTPNGKRFRLPQGLRFGVFFWHLTSFAGTESTVRRWLDGLDEIGPDFLSETSVGTAYEYGCVGLADRIWITEASKEEGERDWGAATSLLDDVVRAGIRHSLPVLCAAARRAQIIILAEYQNQLAEAEKLANDALAESSEPTVQFLIGEVLGRQLLIAQRNEDAVRWLESALACDSSVLDHARFIAELSLSKALSRHAPVDALSAVLRAVQLARAGAFPRTELVKGLGEASIAAARADGPASAFRYLDEAAATVFSSRNDSDAWKDLMVLLAHTAWYFQALTETGRPPPGRTPDGKEISEPQPGLFLTSNPNRPALCGPEHEAHIRCAMALFANAVHNDERLAVWVDSVLDSPLGKNSPELTSVLRLFRIAELAVAEDCARAVQYAKGDSGSPVWVLHALLAVSIRIAHTSLHDADSARRIAQEAAKAMAPIDPAEPFAQLLTVGANLLSLVAARSEHRETFANVANQRGSHELVQNPAMVLASVFEDHAPGQVLARHIAVAMQITTPRIMMNTHLHRRLYLPFLASYWQKFAKRSAFLLRAPSEVQSRLAEAVHAPIEGRAQAIIREVASGLGLDCPEDVASWLRGAGVDFRGM